MEVEVDVLVSLLSIFFLVGVSDMVASTTAPILSDTCTLMDDSVPSIV